MNNSILPTPQPPTALYQGYDSFQGQVRDAALTGTTNTANAQSSNLVTVCTDTDSVMQAISVSASLSGGFFDVSVDAKASWAQSLSLTSTSVVVIVHSVVITGDNQADSYELSNPASGAQDFFDDYGDSFVSEIIAGGEYFAAFVFDSTTASQQQQITASLSGSGGGVTGSLSTAINNAQSQTSVNLRLSQKMYGVSNPTYPSATPPSALADAIVNFALGFGGNSCPINAATVLCFASTGYEHVAGVSGFEQVATNRNLLSGSNTTYVQASAALTALSSQVASVQKVYSAYQYTSDTLFTKNAAQVSTDVGALNKLINQIEANVTGTTYAAPPLPSLGYGTPLLSYTLNPSSAPVQAQWESFFDLTPAQITNGVTPGSITLYDSFGIQVAYTDGTKTSHGVVAGAVTGTLSLQGDSISSFTVFNPPDVMAARITTANGQTLGSVPDSPSQLVTVNAPPPIIGFCGAIYSQGLPPLMLTPIGITMSPALWVQPISTVSVAKRKARPQVAAQAQAQA